MSLPHSLEAINGAISFDAGGIRIDDVPGAARRRRRDLRRPHRPERLRPGDLNLTATGEQMRIRYPEGFRSIIDADLALRGTLSALAAQRHGRPSTTRCGRGAFEPNPDLFNLGRCSSAALGATAAAADAAAALRRRRSTRRRRCASRTTSPTWSRAPTCSCRAPTIGRCSSAAPRSSAATCCSRATATSSRAAPSISSTRRAIEPFFDIEAETRVPACREQTYRVTLGFTGTTSRFSLHAQLGSAAAGGRHHLAAARPDDRPRGCRAAGAAPATRRSRREEALLQAASRGCSTEPDLGAGQPRWSADARRRHRADHAVARQRKPIR